MIGLEGTWSIILFRKLLGNKNRQSSVEIVRNTLYEVFGVGFVLVNV